MESFAGDLARMQRTPLSPAHVEAVRAIAEERNWPAGHVVVTPGEPLCEFVYILDGEIEVFDPITREAYLSSFLGAGQFTGEIAFLNGTAAALALRTRCPSTVLVVERTAMLRLMARIPEVSDIVLSVFAARRRRQIETGDGNLTLVGPEASQKVRSVESFLSRNKVPFRSIAMAETETDETPGVLFGEGGRIADPTPRSVARLLGLDQPAPEETSVDILIVGGGPAGVAAAVYAGAEGLSSLLVEDMAVGGQAGTSSRIENYLGFPTGISGGDLVWRGEIQAMKFGTRFVRPRRVVAVDPMDSGRFDVTLDDGHVIDAGAVIVATGVQYRRLPWSRLEDFEGSGVFYAATETEARYVADKPVIIVGGGNSAGQAAMFLSRSASHVNLLVRGNTLASSMSDYLSSRLEADPAITLHFGAQITGLDGDDALTHAMILSAGTDRQLRCAGVFVMVGAKPETDWLGDLIALDRNGFIITGDAAGGRSQYETSRNGIFAVGDVRADSVKRVASAVGEGSVVISSAWQHVRSPSI